MCCHGVPKPYGGVVTRDGTGRPDVPWDGADWQARVQAGVVDPQRVAAVEATRLLDSEPDESFDQLARLAAAVLGVPWVFVTLVDEHRSFWVSAVDVDPDPDSGLYGENAVVALDQPVDDDRRHFMVNDPT